MIERIENALQIVILVVCTGITVQRALKYRSRTWTLLFFAYGNWLLGDVYWLICLVCYDRTPQVSVVSDLSWYASFIFAYLLLSRLTPPAEKPVRRLLPWLGPVFTLGMAVFFMLRGEIISNLIYAAIMGLLLFASLRVLTDGEVYRKQRFLAAVVLALCLLIYCLWLSSCFWDADTLANPYYWFDFLVTVCFPFFIPATRKAVEP